MHGFLQEYSRAYRLLGVELSPNLLFSDGGRDDIIVSTVAPFPVIGRLM